MNSHLGPFKVVARTIYTTATDPRSKHPSGTMVLERFLEQVPEPPPPNCFCHIASPCRDCEENAGQREVFAVVRAAIAKAKGGKQ